MAKLNYENGNAQNVSALVIKAADGTNIQVSKSMFESLKSDPTIPVMIDGGEGAFTVKQCTAQTATSIVYDTITVTAEE